MVKFLKISQKNEFQQANMESIDLLYKQAGFRKDEFFEKIQIINVKNGTFEVYGKIQGRLCNKNIISILNNEIIGYGTISLLFKIKNEYQDLTKELYEKLIDVNNYQENIPNSNLDLIKKQESDDDSSSDESDDEFLNPELEPDSYLYTSDEEIS